MRPTLNSSLQISGISDAGAVLLGLLFVNVVFWFFLSLLLLPIAALVKTGSAPGARFSLASRSAMRSSSSSMALMFIGFEGRSGRDERMNRRFEGAYLSC